MMIRSVLLVLAVIIGVAVAHEGHNNDDEVVCFQGFVMDTYCVNLGVLLDNPTVKTLQQPEIHSYHCLVDVPRCIADGYEMLAEASLSENDEFPYGRFLRLNAAGNEKVINLARNYGKPGPCSTCTGMLGNETQGLRITVIGTLVPDTGSPPTLATQNVLTYNEGCPEGIKVISPADLDLSFDAGGAQSKIVLHGTLMLLEWGFILPLGIIGARFLRHRPNNMWFQVHVGMQLVGLLYALVGWVIALKNFNVLGSGSGTSLQEQKAYAHAVCGTVTMCIGLLQPLNAFFRPRPPEDGEQKKKSRVAWEFVHKGMGYIGTILALVTIGLGTRIAASYETQFLAGFIASLILLAIIAFILIVDKIRYEKRKGGEKQNGSNEQQSLNESEIDSAEE